MIKYDEDEQIVICGCNHLTNFGVLVVSYVALAGDDSPGIVMI